MTDERIMRSIERYKKLVNLAAPEVILANELALLHKVALARFGRNYADAIARWDIEFAKNWCGTCSKCVNAISDTLPILCSSCALEEEQDWETGAAR